jgi:hypothetical protein
LVVLWRFPMPMPYCQPAFRHIWRFNIWQINFLFLRILGILFHLKV